MAGRRRERGEEIVMNKPFRLHRARLETLVDGVFAIAMTILVLELRVPELLDRRSTAELMQALSHHAYVIGAYFVSFGMLANFWVWHHRLAELVREIDLALLVCVLTLLALVCFFPFATAMLGRYPTNLGALLIYVSLLGIIILLQTLFFRVAIRRQLLVHAVPLEEVLAAHRRNVRGCAIFFLACIPTATRINLWATIGCAVAGGLLLWRAARIGK